MLYRAGKPASGQKDFLAVAAYEGFSAGFGHALYHTAKAMTEAGIESELAIYSGNCHVDDSRNRLVRDFLNSDCTDLVFLDADVRWPEKNMLDLVRYDRDVVAGIYPKKHSDDVYPVLLQEGEIWSDLDGLIEVDGVPTGFLRIKRHVLERMSLWAEHYSAKNDGAGSIPCIFERETSDGIRWGGDYNFCRKWRALGGKIYIAPEMRFEHSGEHAWVGSAGAWLRQKAGIGLNRGIAAIKAGLETAEDAVELFDVYGNGYAATAPLIMALALTARNTKGPILECGAGLSSLVLAAATSEDVHSLEDNPIFADAVMSEAKKLGLNNLHIHCETPVDGWYGLEGLPKLDWGLVFVDGPRRAGGGRHLVFDRIDLSRSTVIVDDAAGENNLPGLITQLGKTHRTEVIDRFVIGAPK